MNDPAPDQPSARRPDPITAKVTVGAGVGGSAGYGLGILIPILADLPEGSAWVEWLRWGLTLAGALGAVYMQAQRAKKETTPTSDPRTDDGHRLVPAGRHEALPPDDGSSYFDGTLAADDPADEQEPPVRFIE